MWGFMTIITYLTFYIDTEVWAFVETDPSRITWVILTLFAMGLIGSAVLALMITKEGLSLQVVETCAKGGGLRGIVGGTAGRNRAVFRFFQALQATIDAEGQPNVEVMSHVELASYYRLSNGVELMGNILITLGLIGTVMGLTMTLTGLTNALDALGHDQEMLLAGLQKAMGGMGTAFYTTLLGAVLGGVLLRVFAQVTEGGVGSLYDVMMRVCLVYCSADYRLSLGRDVRFLNRELEMLEKNVKNIESAFGLSRQAMDGFRNEITQFLRDADHGDGQGSSLEQSIKRHREYCEVLSKEVELMQMVNNTFWARLKALFGVRFD